MREQIEQEARAAGAASPYLRDDTVAAALGEAVHRDRLVVF